jgi:hypothetical protein
VREIAFCKGPDQSTGCGHKVLGLAELVVGCLGLAAVVSHLASFRMRDKPIKSFAGEHIQFRAHPSRCRLDGKLPSSAISRLAEQITAVSIGLTPWGTLRLDP